MKSKVNNRIKFWNGLNGHNGNGHKNRKFPIISEMFFVFNMRVEKMDALNYNRIKSTLGTFTYIRLHMFMENMYTVEV